MVSVGRLGRGSVSLGVDRYVFFYKGGCRVWFFEF